MNPRLRTRLTAILIAAGFATTGLVALSPSAQAALPTGTLTAPASNSTFAAGSTMQLTAAVQDTPGTAGPTAGVRQVEWWLYADKTKGAPTDFSDQYANNTADMINIGVSTVPASGTVKLARKVPLAAVSHAPAVRSPSRGTAIRRRASRPGRHVSTNCRPVPTVFRHTSTTTSGGRTTAPPA
jgi:hypothetical protein